ncbi:MAG: hypothetical protein ACI8W1_001817 [Candidatus Azotimanducaceae bacterium]|jgi:hypothetical protein
MTVPLSNRADFALEQLRQVSGQNLLPGVRGADLLLERALINQYRFGTDKTAAGTCRLLKASDGLVAVNLPRDDDWQLVSAWLEGIFVDEVSSERNWSFLEGEVALKSSSYLLDRAHDLGLAVSSADGMPVKPSSFLQHLASGTRLINKVVKPPRVVDLSALWAGPLCTHLLQRLGADVIKVESAARPDGARAGNSHFYGLLNQSKLSLALDLSTQQGLKDLQLLLASADIVIESSRPRALLQLGINPSEYVANYPGLTWIQLTGHGSAAPQSGWIGYGDDAASAAGLCAQLYEATGQYGFVADAIADPLTGLHAALAAWQSWLSGGGEMIGLSLSEVTSFCIHSELDTNKAAFSAQLKSWPNLAAQINDAQILDITTMVTPHLINRVIEGFSANRLISGKVAALGEDTQTVMQQLMKQEARPS